MWIFPVSPEALQHPGKCEDCGEPIVWAKTRAGKLAAINEGFKVLETLEFGDDGYLHLLPDEAAHARTCEKTAQARPAMRRGRRKNHVGV